MVTQPRRVCRLSATRELSTKPLIAKPSAAATNLTPQRSLLDMEVQGEASGSNVQVHQDQQAKGGKKKQKTKVDKEGKRIREGEYQTSDLEIYISDSL